MATNLSRLVVLTDKNDMAGTLKTQGGPSAYYYRKLSDIFAKFGLGVYQSKVSATPTCVAATGTITLSSSVAADTVTINGTVFTEVSSGATGNQFNHGATDTITAANLAAAINASATGIVSSVVSATSASNVVTVTCLIPGYVGNLCTLAISAHGSVSGANLTSGTEGTTAIFHHGL